MNAIYIGHLTRKSLFNNNKKVIEKCTFNKLVKASTTNWTDFYKYSTKTIKSTKLLTGSFYWKVV